MQSQWAAFIVRAAALLVMATPSASSAAFVAVYGGPEIAMHDEYPFRPAASGSNGKYWGYSEKWIDGRYCGSRASLWNADYTVWTQLGDLGPISSGFTEY